MTPVYLRDLKSSIQDDYIRRWKDEANFDKPVVAGQGCLHKLLEAYIEGKDVIVGQYCNDGDEKIDE